VAGLGLAVLAAWPLLFPGEVPGAGEHALSFSINWDWRAPHAPLDGVAVLVLLALLAVAALQARPRVALGLLALWVGNHLLMAAFDDFGDRHVLPGLIGCAGLVGIGLDALLLRRPRLGWALAGGLVVALSLGLLDMRHRFYLPEADWRGPEGAQVLSLEEARGGCGWIAEDFRVAAEPVRSHFNLLNPGERAALRAPAGCIRWCRDIQDIRWSSRGVRDRAQRLEHLFAMAPLGVVEERESGYICQVFEIEPVTTP
jgi:hypothetical protein